MDPTPLYRWQTFLGRKMFLGLVAMLLLNGSFAVAVALAAYFGSPELMKALGAITTYGASGLISIRNSEGYSTQLYPVLNGNSTFQNTTTSLLNTATNWTVDIGFSSTSGATNVGFYALEVRETVRSP
jgi:hypothetical protein